MKTRKVLLGSVCLLTLLCACAPKQTLKPPPRFFPSPPPAAPVEQKKEEQKISVVKGKYLGKNPQYAGQELNFKLDHDVPPAVDGVVRMLGESGTLSILLKGEEILLKPGTRFSVRSNHPAAAMFRWGVVVPVPGTTVGILYGEIPVNTEAEIKIQGRLFIFPDPDYFIKHSVEELKNIIYSSGPEVLFSTYSVEDIN